jgi:acetyltransferase-like isoleucine patch superfamily enzyme
LTSAIRWFIFSLAVVPSYVLFALILMPISALATGALGWRTARNAEMRIAEVEWPLLNWARSMMAIHVVRLFAGTLFRGSPIWTAYLRTAGARLGRRVYVNSLSISDYNLLEFGDDVVIGADAHISSHTVEGGVVKTAGVRLGRNVTVGLGSVIDIDVEIGPDCQIGALSLVPKHTKLEAGGVYAGIPARKLE